MAADTLTPKTLFKPLSLVILLFAGFYLTACSNSASPTKTSFIVFGTQVDIAIYQTPKQQALAAIQQVEQRFQQFHQEWHAWQKGGIVSKINHAIANNQTIEIAPSIKKFIIKSQQLTKQSQGLFDPGIGSLVALWGFHSENWQGPPPSQVAIDNWLQHSPSIADIEFSNNMLLSKNNKVQLDFGGNAKGLAIDIALNTLQSFGIDNALVSIGGDMKALGHKDQQQTAWAIGIQTPKNPTEMIAKLQLNSGESVVTSGTYQRYFAWQGKHYSHILNPKTGYPADSFASVTVIHQDATTADAAATALLVAGPKDWQQIAKSMQIDYVFAIDQQGNTLQTKAMAQRIKLL